MVLAKKNFWMRFELANVTARTRSCVSQTIKRINFVIQIFFVAEVGFYHFFVNIIRLRSIFLEITSHEEKAYVCFFQQFSQIFRRHLLTTKYKCLILLYVYIIFFMYFLLLIPTDYAYHLSLSLNKSFKLFVSFCSCNFLSFDKFFFFQFTLIEDCIHIIWMM